MTIIVPERMATAKEKAAIMRAELAAMVNRGGPRRKVFVVVTGLFRNHIQLMGPDAAFKGLDGMITTGHEEGSDES